MVSANPVSTLAPHEAARLLARPGWAPAAEPGPRRARARLAARRLHDRQRPGSALHHVLAQTLVRRPGSATARPTRRCSRTRSGRSPGAGRRRSTRCGRGTRGAGAAAPAAPRATPSHRDDSPRCCCHSRRHGAAGCALGVDPRVLAACADARGDAPAAAEHAARRRPRRDPRALRGRPLRHVVDEAAVDAQRAAGRRRRLLGGEVGDEVRDLDRLDQPLDQRGRAVLAR